MTQYHRFGHLQEIFVKLGQKVKKGEKIGTNGTGNGQWPAHLHYDCPMKEFKVWTSYVFGWTKEEVLAVYADPKKWRMLVAPWFDHFGWKYLELATYGAKKCFHPGEDLNGKGSGNSDLGDPIYSPCDGEVVYIYNGTGSNSGWGKLLVVKEMKIEEIKPVLEPQNEEIAPNITKSPESDLAPKMDIDTKKEDSFVPSAPAAAESEENTEKLLRKIIETIINFIKSIIFKK